jgi:hypothetical protein
MAARLYFSETCAFSRKMLDLLSDCPALANQIELVEVNGYFRNENVSVVPTLEVLNADKQKFLTGKEAFDWLYERLCKNKQQQASSSSASSSSSFIVAAAVLMLAVYVLSSRQAQQ